MLTADEILRLRAAAERSMFPEFWVALIEAVQASGLSPVRLLGPTAGTFRFREPVRAAVERLWAAECPFDLYGSPWGHQAMLGAFRRLAAEAGIAGAETIEFDVLYA